MKYHETINKEEEYLETKTIRENMEKPRKQSRNMEAICGTIPEDNYRENVEGETVFNIKRC